MIRNPSPEVGGPAKWRAFESESQTTTPHRSTRPPRAPRRAAAPPRIPFKLNPGGPRLPPLITAGAEPGPCSTAGPSPHVPPTRQARSRGRGPRGEPFHGGPAPHGSACAPNGGGHNLVLFPPGREAASRWTRSHADTSPWSSRSKRRCPEALPSQALHGMGAGQALHDTSGMHKRSPAGMH